MNSDEERNWDNFLLEVATKRQEQGMTHKDLADNAGTVERTISRLLSEPTKNPSLFLVASICQALHISLDKHFVKEVYNKTDSQNSEEMIEVLKEQVAPAPEAVQNTLRSYFCPAGDDDFIPRPNRCK